MPTRKPRIALTVPDDIKDIFDYTAGQMGVTTSGLVLQIMEENKDSVLAIGKALEKAKSDPQGALKEMQKLVVDSLQTAQDGQIDIEEAITRERKKAKKAK